MRRSYACSSSPSVSHDMGLLQPMTANFSRPDDPEEAKAERRKWMQTMCPMHQTMVAASAIVSESIVQLVC